MKPLMKADCKRCLQVGNRRSDTPVVRPAVFRPRTVPLSCCGQKIFFGVAKMVKFVWHLIVKPDCSLI